MARRSPHPRNGSKADKAKPSKNSTVTLETNIAEAPPGRPRILLNGILCGLLALELTLSFLQPRSYFHFNELPLGARLLVLGYTTTVLTLTVWLIGMFANLAGRFQSALGLPPHSMRWIAGTALTFLVFIYVLSWATFWQVGRFLDGEALRFWRIQPLQVFHWVDLDVGALVVAATLAVGLLIFYCMPRWIADRNPLTQNTMATGVKLGLGACVFAAGLGEIYAGRTEQAYLRSTLLYLRARDEASTPAAHLVGNIRAALLGRPDETRAVKAARLIRRKITPMPLYLTAVDRTFLKRWNVIVIVVESLRSDQLRAYGGHREVMPAVESLARVSRVFTNTRSQSSQTSYAVLAPLSSHYPLRSATQYAYPENPSYPRVLIQDVLKPIGYRTAAFSSSNENWEGMIHYLQTGNIDHLFHAPVFRGKTYFSPGDTFFGNWVMTTNHAGSVDDRFTIEHALDWIDQSAEQPFFMYINLQNSHVPYHVPHDFPRRFSPNEINFTIRFGYFPRDKIDAVKDVYADSLSYVDAQIGRLLKHLRHRNLWDSTLIVVTGDHGQGFYEHGFTAHGGAIFDEVMKVPLLIRAPGVIPGVDPRPAQHIDVAPSVFDLLGLPMHPSFQGRSLFDPVGNAAKSIFMVAQTPLAYQYGILRSDWKLIYDERRRNYLLFNLATDPGETVDLSLKEKATLQHLADRLHAWRSTQIRYYSDRDWHTREYPPILEE